MTALPARRSSERGVGSREIAASRRGTCLPQARRGIFRTDQQCERAGARRGRASWLHRGPNSAKI